MMSGKLSKFEKYPENLITDLDLAVPKEYMNIVKQRADRIIELLEGNEHELAAMYYREQHSIKN